MNTLTNLGGTWPRYFVLKGVDFFTMATCKVAEGGSETILPGTCLDLAHHLSLSCYVVPIGSFSGNSISYYAFGVLSGVCLWTHTLVNFATIFCGLLLSAIVVVGCLISFLMLTHPTPILLTHIPTALSHHGHDSLLTNLISFLHFSYVHPSPTYTYTFLIYRPSHQSNHCAD